MGSVDRLEHGGWSVNVSKLALFASGIFFGGALDHAIRFMFGLA